MGGSSRTCIWIFNKTLKKNALKRNSVWFRVRFIKNIVPALELVHGLFSGADVAGTNR